MGGVEGGGAEESEGEETGCPAKVTEGVGEAEDACADDCTYCVECGMVPSGWFGYYYY